jgi:hypothetical protein
MDAGQDQLPDILVRQADGFGQDIGAFRCGPVPGKRYGTIRAKLVAAVLDLDISAGFTLLSDLAQLVECPVFMHPGRRTIRQVRQAAPAKLLEYLFAGTALVRVADAKIGPISRVADHHLAAQGDNQGFGIGLAGTAQHLARLAVCFSGYGACVDQVNIAVSPKSTI